MNFQIISDKSGNSTKDSEKEEVDSPEEAGVDETNGTNGSNKRWE